ncbi:MAG TPA: biosynthetic-type acetolactate synthase large subunit [Sulfurihydrogenibium sp.]|uniref:biosynthetic-type acetolactate synthase large subunit n=1 Tax=Sulfurihydrogenibium sp. (strain YO3AOP1) TaxID=436114 RepID=UPI00017249C2|nr:biosynthetic-type acetolactate synthase large subunit [Sulfurihydrogenibium sp. YO3AOP1]ACD65876.1 acetolactate synthase, large subunit, biosynthetic type [Sulfurihydrogenibium sp. YO3AOP1]HBT99351.1 biosynthetic-type acetolactate synthase large subunit [Sulfurihydrogenibium sp.]
MTKEKRGADIVVDVLIKEGVDTVFGLPGGAIMEVYDALFDAPFRNVLTRHEQAACHMADGYARATGKVGVVIATSGPGATNLVTGLATAYMDSIPLVAITGQVPRHYIGTDAFQEADVIGITRPITKHNFLVTDIKDLPLILRQAFYIARTGRPGPVLVDIPKDITQQKTTYKMPTDEEVRESLPGYNPHTEGNPVQIKKAAELIRKATRPVLYVGGGAILSDAAEEIYKLAHLAQIPVTTTNMGKGAFPETDPLSLHMLGMHGTYYANMAVYHSDLLIAVGARFDDRVTGKINEFAPEAKIIHIDIDPASISKTITVDVPIVGDVKNVLRKLIKELEEKPIEWIAAREQWLKQINEWKEKHPLNYRKSDKIIKPQAVIEEIYNITNGEAIISAGVGQHQMWAAMFYKYKYPRQFLNSGGLGTMGFGFPAAVGAKIGRPDKTVFAIEGDGSFIMNVQDLATAVQYRVPVKIAIINNGFLGMVRQWQQFFYDSRYASVCLSVQPDFVKLAESFGAVGLRATKPSEVREVLLKAMEINDRPVLMDFVVDKEENVLPMVPAGKSYREMILTPNQKGEAETMYLVG